MKLSKYIDFGKLKKEKSTKNVVVGLLYQIISISMGLILPHLFITELGSESNGLMSSVGQAFTCLGLLEAGVGMTTIQALYKPISENNSESIKSILSATNKYYQKTGLWYAILVAVLAAVYPFFIKGEISSTTIRLVILLQGAGAVIAYLFQSKYSLFLQAEGKKYVLTSFMTVMLVFRNFGKIFALQLGYGLLVVQFFQFLTVVIEAVFIISYIKKKYPWLTMDSEPDYQALGQKNSVLLQSVAWMIFNHTDILILTVFTGDLGLVSVYSLYSLVFEVGQNVMNEIREAFRYKLGNVAQMGDNELDKFYSVYCSKIMTITFACFSVIYLASVPFVRLYTVGVKDTDYFIRWIPELFFIYKLLYGMRCMNKQIIEVKGLFKKTQHIPLAESVANVVLSVILVYNYGIVGVLIGTVVALLISAVMYCLQLRKTLKNAIQLQIRLSACHLLLFVGTITFYNMYPFQIQSWISLIAFSCIIGIFYLLICSLIEKIIDRKYKNHSYNSN